MVSQQSQREEIGRAIRTSEKGVLFGPLFELILYFMMVMPYADRCLDRKKALDLFERQRPGFLGRDNRCEICVRVRCKRFGEWVRQNAGRMIVTRREERAALRRKQAEDPGESFPARSLYRPVDTITATEAFARLSALVEGDNISQFIGSSPQKFRYLLYGDEAGNLALDNCLEDETWLIFPDGEIQRHTNDEFLECRTVDLAVLVAIVRQIENAERELVPPFNPDDYLAVDDSLDDPIKGIGSAGADNVEEWLEGLEGFDLKLREEGRFDRVDS